jgi:hypothetical protein
VFFSGQGHFEYLVVGHGLALSGGCLDFHNQWDAELVRKERDDRYFEDRLSVWRVGGVGCWVDRVEQIGYFCQC